MRRLLVQLTEPGLPVDPFHEHEGGPAFDLLSSYSGQQRVTIGHAKGVITIDLIEMFDDWQWLSLLVNRLNHAMGHGDMHPFTLTEAVRTELDFVNRVVQDVASRNSGQPVLVCVPAVHLRH